MYCATSKYKNEMNKSRKRICFLCDSKNSLSYHKFPKKESLKSLWLQACNLTPNDKVNTLTICSLHFKENDFVDLNAKKFGGVIRLQPNAVPSSSVRCNTSAAIHLSGSSKQSNVPFITAGIPSYKIIVQPLTLSYIEQKKTVKPEIITGTLDKCVSPEVSTVMDGTNVVEPSICVKEEAEEEVLCNEEQHDMETEMSTPKTGKRLFTQRYVGDLSDIDVCTPRRAKMALKMAKEAITRYRQQIKRLQQQNRRLHLKVRRLTDELLHVTSKKKIHKRFAF